MGSSVETREDPILELVEEFLERARRGEQPTIEEYCERHPNLAEDIRDLFPALLVMEDVQPNSDASGAASSIRADLPDQIGDYRIISELGRGGMGVVYEAEQISLGRRVALKVLPNTVSAKSESARVRFRREARAAARMHHTNIVPVFEVGQDGDHFFYAMQLIQGQSLDLIIDELKDVTSGTRAETLTMRGTNEQQVQSSPKSSATSIVQKRREDSIATSGHQFRRSSAKIALQAAEALAYAHARGVIHRDIKPSNLMLDPDGVVWVTDFGLAKTEDEGLTQTGDFLGTLRYMSPERFRGECDARADIYALGLTLYELLLQRAAFTASDRLKLIDLVSTTEPRKPRTLDPRIPRDLETVILKCIEKEPAQRYQTAKALAQDLQRYLNDEPVLARRASAVERLSRWGRRNKGLATALAGIAALLLLIAAGSFATSIYQSQLRQQAEASQRNAEHEQSIAETARQLADEREHERRRHQYFAEMNLAVQRIDRAGGAGGLIEMTDRWRNDIADEERGWEWFYLRTVGTDRAVSATGETATDIAWSPDDNFIVMACFLNNARIRDSQNGQLLQNLTGHTDRVECAAWHPNRNLVATGAKDKTIRLWNSDTGECLKTIGPFQGPVASIAWNADGTSLAFVAVPHVKGKVGTSHLHTLEIPSIDALDEFSPEERGEIVAFPPLQKFNANRSLQWSPDGTQIAASMSRGAFGQDMKLAVWDVAKRTILREPFEGAALAWGPNGNGVHQYAVPSNFGEIQLRDGKTGKQIQKFLGHTAQVCSLNFHPDGKFLLSSAYDQTARIWNIATGREARVFQEHSGGVLTSRWNRVGTQIASSAWDGRTLFWSNNERFRKIIPNNPKPDAPIASTIQLDWHPDSRQLATSGTSDWSMTVHDTESGKLSTITLNNYFSRCVWNPQGTRVAYSGDVIRIWSPSGRKWTNAQVDDGPSSDIDWNPNGLQFVVAVSGRDEAAGTHAIRVFSDGGNMLTELLRTDQRWNAVAWNPVLDHLVAVGGDGADVHLVDLRNQETIAELKVGSPINSLDWNSKGSLLASASNDGVVRIWNPNDGTCLHTLEGHNNRVHQVKWHPDGRRLASAGNDSSVKVWDVKSGTEILSLDDHHSAVQSVSWSPDGFKLAAGDMSGQIIVWDATPAYEEEAGR